MNELSAPDRTDQDAALRRAIALAADAVFGGGDEIFRHLVQHLATALNVNYAFVGTMVPGKADHASVVAMYADGEFAPSFEYSLKGTPCEYVVGQQFRYYPSGVQQQFDSDNVRQLRTEGYAGIPLFDSAGGVLGLMVVMDRQPLGDEGLVENLLRIFSVRAALELERMQAERTAREKGDQFMAVFQSTHDGFVLFDQQGQVVDANPAFKRMHGYALDDDFHRRDPFEFIPEDGREVYFRFLQEVSEHGHFHMEGLGQRTDGEHIQVDINGVRLFYNGQPHMLAIVRDVTRERQAEKDLKGREEQYRTVFGSTSDGMALWTRAGELVDVNDACCRLHGMTREQLLQAELTEFVPPESMPILQEMMATVAQGKSYKGEAIATHKDGSVFQLDIRGEPAEFQGEQHVLLILRDITEHKSNIEELRRSEDRFRATVEAALDCIVTMDEQGRVLEFNPAAERCFGYRRQDIIGKSLADYLIPPDLRDQHIAGMQRYLQQGAGPYLGKRIEISAMRADGSIFPVELAIDAAHGDSGKIFIGYIRDITESKQAEADRSRLEGQLRQAQKMEAIGHLTGGIAHDFNNILTGIMGYIVMAQEWEEKHADEKLHRYLERVQKSAQRARDLIQQMLTFSRGQRGEARALRLKPFVKESIKLLESSLPATLEVRFECDDNLPRVMVDPVHLGQVLMNLCLNARDAMGGQGVLDISLRQAECKTDCVCASCRKGMAGDYVELCVADSGTGLSSETLDRVFEPFYTTKEVGKGSGMGLAMVHGIVHEYGGHIRVDSEPGQGARFCVMLPVADGAGSAEEAGSDFCKTSSQPALAGTVLLAEDDVNVGEFMQDRLSDWGLSVHWCRNGLEALEHVQQGNADYDLYIFDYSMPKMTGLELAQKLLADNAAARIVLYTGYSEDISEEDVLARGIKALVRKPINDDAFRALIVEQLSHGAGRQPGA